MATFVFILFHLWIYGESETRKYVRVVVPEASRCRRTTEQLWWKINLKIVVINGNINSGKMSQHRSRKLFHSLGALTNEMKINFFQLFTCSFTNFLSPLRLFCDPIHHRKKSFLFFRSTVEGLKILFFFMRNLKTRENNFKLFQSKWNFHFSIFNFRPFSIFFEINRGCQWVSFSTWMEQNFTIFKNWKIKVFSKNFPILSSVHHLTFWAVDFQLFTAMTTFWLCRSFVDNSVMATRDAENWKWLSKLHCCVETRSKMEFYQFFSIFLVSEWFNSRIQSAIQSCYSALSLVLYQSFC